ncbi:MAG: 3-deoxy-manno-octulosonate cytidylyltransferase [Chromatiales bacterium USCg_Taylor]|nr:MAG: 3-deoxy-manno-octulosonate cytidylyltransferase [Chromatiales bacterium USCg_Taylor]
MNVIVIQARMGSTRLPGKVMLDLCGAPLIVRMLERVQRIRTPARIVVAVTTEAADDCLFDVCRARGFEVFRGHPTDLLDRHYQGARAYGAEVVAKVPSDCPLIDPAIIDAVFERFAQGDCDYASNLHPPSYPDGNDAEVMSMSALASAWREAAQGFEREHTTPFLWEHGERFRLANVAWDPRPGDAPVQDYSMSHRWTLDYPEDYEFIRRVYAALYPRNPAFGLEDILRLLERAPDLLAINARYAGVNWYRHHLSALRTITAAQTRVIG